MKHKSAKNNLVLAITPTSRGFGFAIFEGALSPIDWGVKDIRNTHKSKNAQCLERIEELIEIYEPNMIVTENNFDGGSRRCERVKRLISEICKLAGNRKIKLRRYSREDIKNYFSNYGSSTKYQIAVTISNWLPEFAPRLPNYRKPWMSEDYRMAIFTAVSLAMTFYYQKLK